MAKFVYLVRTGGLNTFTQEFNLTNYYLSSLKKAKREMFQILKINRAKNVRNSFNTIPFHFMLEALDYEGEEGKYTARIIIEKHELK